MVSNTMRHRRPFFSLFFFLDPAAWESGQRESATVARCGSLGDSESSERSDPVIGIAARLAPIP